LSRSNEIGIGEIAISQAVDGKLEPLGRNTLSGAKRGRRVGLVAAHSRK
jgi:hypothetical protein